MSESRIMTITWVALLVLTGVSVLVAETGLAPGLIATGVVVLGYVKFHLIFTNFMEVHPKMMPWRGLLEAWGVLAVLAILVPYWISLLS